MFAVMVLAREFFTRRIVLRNFLFFMKVLFDPPDVTVWLFQQIDCTAFLSFSNSSFEVSFFVFDS